MGTAVPAVTVAYDTSGGNPNLTTVSGLITVSPNHVAAANPARSQNYDQVGPTYLKVSWHQLTGKVSGNDCPGAGSCSGTFQGEQAGGTQDIQQQFYMSDPLASAPLVGTSVNPAAGRSFPALGSTGPFSIAFQHTAVDKDHVVLLRESVQSSGNRTKAVYCGNSPGQGAKALENAIKDGCAKDLTLNTRSDSCAPAPLPSASPWDCVQLEQGNKTGPVNAGAAERFACTPNNWVNGGPLPLDGDQRWAYIILTGYGRTFPAGNNDWLPIEGLLRVYVTGWNDGDKCNANDPPPRGYDDKGAQLWGHFVQPITIDPAVIVGDGKCDLTNDNIQCSPRLVR